MSCQKQISSEDKYFVPQDSKTISHCKTFQNSYQVINIIEPVHEICDQQSLRSACAYAQSDQSLCLSLEYSTIVKLLMKFLSFKGDCTGSYESTLVKMQQCLKSHATAQLYKYADASIHDPEYKHDNVQK